MFLSIEIEMLKDLYSNLEGEKIYSFYTKYNLSPSEIANTILSYRDSGYITINQDSISLTDKGRRWVFENRKELFLKPREQYWKIIRASDLLEVNRDANLKKHYVPDIEKIDKQLFIINKKNGKKN